MMMEGVTNEAHVLQVNDDRVSDFSSGIETGGCSTLYKNLEVRT